MAATNPVFPALSRNSAVPAPNSPCGSDGGFMNETLTRTGGSTVLNLLTDDGAMSVVFPAFLTGEQYEMLFEAIREHADSRFGLREHIAMLAKDWGLDASFEDGVA